MPGIVPFTLPNTYHFQKTRQLEPSPKPECARRITRDGIKYQTHRNVNRAGEHVGINGKNSVDQ